MKTKKIMYWKTLLIGLLFIAFGGGSIWFNILRNDAEVFILFGMLFVLYAVYKNYKYGKPGEASQDERLELNVLKASRIGFLFLVFSQAVLIFFWGQGYMTENTIFAGLTMALWGTACILYIVSYYVYERSEETNQIPEITLYGILIIGLISVAGGLIFITQFDFNQTTEIHEIAVTDKVENGNPIGAKTEFKNDAEIIYACANVTSTPFESGLYVRWYNIYGGWKVLEDNAVIDCNGCCWQCFNITKPAGGWKPGKHVVDFHIYAGEEKSAYSDFEIIN